MSVPTHEEGRVHDRGRREGMGVELEEIPLCNVCGVEMSGESPGKVLERGLENVSRFDGGLSRERLERWSEMSNEDAEERYEETPPTVSSKQLGRAPTHRESSPQPKKGCSRCSVSSSHAQGAMR